MKARYSQSNGLFFFVASNLLMPLIYVSGVLARARRVYDLFTIPLLIIL